MTEWLTGWMDAYMNAVCESSVLTFDEHQLDGQDQSSVGCCMTAPHVYSDCQGFSHAAHMSALCPSPNRPMLEHVSRSGLPAQQSQ